MAYIIIQLNLPESKEEFLRIIMKSRPINISFVPESLELPFKDKLKLQIAFYRNNKVCKTKPMKFLRTQISSSTQANIPHIQFDKQELVFCTTIGYDSQSEFFESKEIDIQMACDADGKKQIFEHKIDLKELIRKSTSDNNQLKIVFNSETRFNFSVKSKFQDLTTENQQVSHSPTPFQQGKGKSKKKPEIIKLQEIQNNDIKAERVQRKKKRITFKDSTRNNEEFSVTPQKKVQANSQKNQFEGKNHFDGKNSNNDSEKGSNKSHKSQSRASIDGASKINSTMLQTLSKLKEQILKIKQEKTKEAVKLNHQITKLKQSLQSSQLTQKTSQNENQQLERLKKQLQGQLSTKNQQLRKLKKQIKELREKKLKQSTETSSSLIQLNKRYKQMQDKYTNLSNSQDEWRKKYQASEANYLSVISTQSQLKYEVEKLTKQIQKLKKKEKEDQIQFQSQLESIRHEYAHRKGSDNISDELQNMRKQLLKKQAHIKKLDKSHDEKYKESQLKITQMKKQIQELKSAIEHLKKAEHIAQGSISTLDMKINTQKLKKQCDQAKKLEKHLLVEKSQLQTRNKSMSEEIVKLKETIANMLNLIQQKGTQDLFTSIADCIS